jgi:hypothetical protein
MPQSSVIALQLSHDNFLKVLLCEPLKAQWNTDQLSLFLPSGTAPSSSSKTRIMAGSSAPLRAYFSYHTFSTTSSHGSRSDPSYRSGGLASSLYHYFAFNRSG